MAKWKKDVFLGTIKIHMETPALACIFKKMRCATSEDTYYKY